MACQRVGEVDLCYELDDGDGPVLVLVNGLGRPHVGWDPRFLDLLRAEGFRLLCFCNRDAGRSTVLDDAPPFDLGAALRADRSVVTYTLDDMADDTAGLLQALGVDGAHLLGTSMGGMIAQMVAVRHRGLVRSLASIMSTTGARGVGIPTPEAAELLRKKAPEGRDAYVTQELENQRIIGSRGALVDEQWRRRLFERVYDHGVHPQGTGRQLMAIVASGDRTAALARISAPTVVVHGEVDTLVAPSGGVATAEAVPGARLVMIPDMGHELPPSAWPDVVAAVIANARAADARLHDPIGDRT